MHEWAPPHSCIRALFVDGASLHHRHLRLRQPIQLIHQRVDLSVGRVDLALQRGPDVRRLLRDPWRQSA